MGEPLAVPAGRPSEEERLDVGSIGAAILIDICRWITSFPEGEERFNIGAIYAAILIKVCDGEDGELYEFAGELAAGIGDDYAVVRSVLACCVEDGEVG